MRPPIGRGLALSSLLSFALGAVLTANANATVYDPDTLVLPTLTLTLGSANPSASIVGSYLNTDYGSFGDSTVLGTVQTEFGSGLTEVGGGDCSSGGPPTCPTSPNNSFTYDSSTGADVFAIHWGGGGSDQPLLVIEFDQLVTDFSLSGFAHGVSFVRSFSEPTTTGGQGMAAPVPGTLPLFVGGLGLIGLFGWRRKRKAQAAAVPMLSGA
jgi:PEP-CTERM motif